MTKRIAIIGAGLAALTLAHRLGAFNDVEVYEKARGVGGRMSTRHNDQFFFDHGAQFFTARDKRFRNFLVPHLASGLVQEWRGKVITLEVDKKTTDRIWFEPHYVACPAMNSLCKQLAENVAVHLNCEIAPLEEKAADGWHLFTADKKSLGVFDLIISTAPPAQTSRLFDTYLPPDATLRRSKLLACYTLMFGFNKKWDQSWIAAKILGSPLEWIAVNSTKPGRNKDVTSLTVHSSNVWAEEHVDDDLKQAEVFLRDCLCDILPITRGAADSFALHRWRYALRDKAHDDQTRDRPYFDQSLGLASVGDWGTRSRIEDVWLEANQLADDILS